jgi:prophage antirepressor-like protein
MCERILAFEQFDVGVRMAEGVAYFRASDVTSALGYANGSQAVKAHVSPAYTRTFPETGCGSVSAVLCRTENVGNASTGVLTKGFKQPTYISEAGVYELVWHSKKQVALRFRDWVVSEVLPEIRKNGRFVRHEQVSLLCEADLHYKVVAFVRRFFPEAVIVPGLGELQDTEEKRKDAWCKGYRSGQPDILILNRTRSASGLALELKTPLCQRSPSPNQEAFLLALQKSGFETLVSGCYDEIVVKILEFREASRRCRRRKL